MRYKNDTAVLKASIAGGASLLQRALDLMPSPPTDTEDEEGKSEEVQALRSEIVEYLDKLGSGSEGSVVLCVEAAGEAKCRQAVHPGEPPPSSAATVVGQCITFTSMQ
jgi:hypothetical protein